MDLVKYESEVMLHGPWSNYQELEDSLSLDELLELYGKVVENRNEETERLARLLGAEVQKTGGGDVERNAFDRIAERFRSEKGPVKPKSTAAGVNNYRTI